MDLKKLLFNLMDSNFSEIQEDTADSIFKYLAMVLEKCLSKNTTRHYLTQTSKSNYP